MNNKAFLVLFSLLYIMLSLILYSYVTHKTAHFDEDSYAYHHYALRFFEHNTFLDQQHPKIQRFTWPYPLFLALLYKIFTPRIFPVIFLQIGMSILTGLFLFLLVKRLFNALTARLSFILFTLNLGFLVFPQFLLMETILVFFLVIFLERFTAYIIHPTITSLTTAMFMLGISVLIKPVALYYIIFIVFGILSFQKTHNFSKITALILALLCFYTPLVAYKITNGLTVGTYTISTSDEVNLYLWLWPKVRAQENNSSFNVEVQKIMLMFNTNINVTRNLFWNHFLKKPFSFIKVWSIGIIKTCFGLFLSNLKVLLYQNFRGTDLSFFSTGGTLPQRIHAYIATGIHNPLIIMLGYFEALYHIIIYVLGLIALWTLIIQKRWSTLYLASTYIFYFALVTGHDGCSRYRLTFEPILIMLAAFGLYVCVQWYRNTQKTAIIILRDQKLS